MNLRCLSQFATVITLVLGGVVAGGSTSVAAPDVVPVSGAAVASDEVRFTAVGDFAATAETNTVLDRIRTVSPDLHLALGDFSYGATGAESAWCDLVKARVGPTVPFQLISGNHESNGLNGKIDAFVSCLPNRLPGVTGTYGRQWYVDVPQDDPVARFVMISPGLTFPDGKYSYAAGTPRYNWTAAAIDGARSANIPWVVVGMHVPCLSMTAVACGSGADLMNLLVSKKVDLVLGGHNHLYERTKQLATSTACRTITPGSSSGSCIADGDDHFNQGSGTVFATVGTGGAGLQRMSASDPERAYFAKWAGTGANPTWGLLDVSLDETSLTGNFRPTSGGNFTDSFTVARQPGPGGNKVPVASFTSVPDGLSVAFDGSGSSDPDGNVASYAWDFGDGSSASGARPGHTYTATGTYPVKLTVTDNQGATGAVTHQVSVTAVSGTTPGFVGAAHSAAGATRFKAVTVPTAARAGDTMLLFLTRNTATTWSGPTGVTGWTQVDTFVNGSIQSTLWKKTAAAADPGASIRVDATTYTKGVLSLGVYSGLDPTAITGTAVAHAGDTNTATHRSPTLTPTAGSWALTYWADKSAGTTTWTAPAAVTVRDTSADTGSGRFGSLMADSNRALPASPYGALTATTNATSSQGATWTITLPPQP